MTIFSLNIRIFIYMVWTREIHILIKSKKYVFIKPKIYINDIFRNHKIHNVSYAVQTVENTFTWCGHEKYIR